MKMKEINLQYFVTILFVYFSNTVDAAPSPAAGMRYLQHFGYVAQPDPRLGNILSQEDMVEGLRVFQRFAGIPQTGTFDKTTLKKMDEPRCGNPDIVGTEMAARKKRYALQGSKWQKKNIRYRIASHTGDMHKRDTEEAIAKAFKEWEKVSGLTFEKMRGSGKPDIEIRFASGSHGDGDPFDGPSKTLAHAFFPQFGGDAHFDEDETWVKAEKNNGVKLFVVAAHEFGHSLGLSHSDVNEALMAPFYNPRYTELHADDIKAIQTLYGPSIDRKKPVTTTKKPAVTRPTRRPTITRATTTTKTPPVGACNGRFDAITTVSNGSTFAFLDEYYWRLNDYGMEKGFPRKTSSDWGFEGKVDAILTHRLYTDIFQGEYVRRFYNNRPIRGFPKLISEVYPGVPSNIDTAYVWSGNGRIYIMKGDQYWRFNPSTKKTDDGYPRPLSVWKGIPESVDAALQWKDTTYFFKNGYYWKYDDERFQVAQSLKVPYPRRSDEWWLGCSDHSLLALDQESVRKRVKEENDGGNGAGSQFKGGMSLQVMTSSVLLLLLSKLFS